MLKAPGKSTGPTGTRILLEAMSKDKVHLARFVLDALDGQIVDSKTEGAQTPLISSILLPEGHTRCKFAELLLQRGASVNCQDGNGRTALSYACEKGYLDAVKILVRNNADPEIVDLWGNSALMYAAAAGHYPVVEFLVRAFKRLGLQIDRQNKVGNSAIEVAKFLGHADCIFALTNHSRKGRESLGAGDEDVPENAQSSSSLESEFENKVGHLVNKLEVLQTCNHAHCPVVQNCTWQPRPRIKQSRLPSMDSIEEFERENDGSSSSSQDLVFSPLSPPRTYYLAPNFKHPNTREKLVPSDDHLPPLTQKREMHKSIFLSPQPSGSANKSCASSALSILLTTTINKKSECTVGTDKSRILNLNEHKFQDSYYKKRCSLPTSVLSPAPPERTRVPLRKSRTARKLEVTPGKAEPLQLTSAATTISVLSNKLLRRFTSPEFKKDVKEQDQNPVIVSERIPRSQTFPQGVRHPQVDSKPSIDSISSVKCEFDFHFRNPNS